MIDKEELTWPGADKLIKDGFKDEILPELDVYLKTGEVNHLKINTDPRYVFQRENSPEHDKIEFEFIERLNRIELEKIPMTTQFKAIVEGPAGVGKTTFIKYCLGSFRLEKAGRNTPVLILWFNHKYKRDPVILSLAKQIAKTLNKVIDDSSDANDNEEFIAEKFRPLITIAEKINNGFEPQEWECKRFIQFFLETFRETKGFVVLVHDDIDQIRTLPTRENDRRILTEIFSSFITEEWFRCIDVLIIATRPNTVADYARIHDIRPDFDHFKIKKVDLHKAISERLQYTQGAFNRSKIKTQIASSYKLATNRRNFSHDGPDWWVLGDELTVSVPFYNQKSSKEACRVLSNAVSLVTDAFVGTGSIAEELSTAKIVGKRGTEAVRILKHLCGMSMRRAVVLTRALVTYPGIRKDFNSLVGESNEVKRVRAYTLIDSLVDSSLSGEMENSFILNVFDRSYYRAQSERGPAQDSFFFPFVLHFLERKFPGDIEKVIAGQHEFGEYFFVSKDWIFAELGKLGFSEERIEDGVTHGKEVGLFVASIDANDEVIGYYVNANLLKAHVFLLCEAAYIDNCAKYHSLIESQPKTVGYKPEDLAHRIRNSTLFLKWLRDQESSFFAHLQSVSMGGVLSELNIPSIFSLAFMEYHARITNLPNLDYDGVKDAICDFEALFCVELKTLGTNLSVTNPPI